jgi:IclR family acetate operon transcriptional repressor
VTALDVTNTEKSGPQTANMLLRGLAVLESVARSGSRRGVSVTEVSLDTGLEKSTASRILSILRDSGYLRQDGYRRYRLTARLSQLSVGYSDIEDLLAVARPHLEALHEAFDEEVHLAVLDGGYMVFVDYIPSSQVVRSTLSTTQRLVHETAAGRAALCLLDREARHHALELSSAGGDVQLSDADIDRIMGELDEARERGWAGFDANDGVTRFAAPIVDSEGSPIAAMCISGPTYRVVPSQEQFATAVMAAAQAVSGAM